MGTRKRDGWDACGGGAGEVFCSEVLRGSICGKGGEWEVMGGFDFYLLGRLTFIFLGLYIQP